MRQGLVILAVCTALTLCAAGWALAGVSMNIAPSGTASCEEAQYHGGYPPANAIDGLMATEWSTRLDHNEGHWLRVDWSSPKIISKVVVYNWDGRPEYLTRTYTAEVTSNGVDWETVATVVSPGDYVVTFDFAAKSVLAVRVNNVDDVLEMEVYTDAASYASISGKVLTGSPAAGVCGARITGGALPVVSGVDGSYAIEAPIGVPLTIHVSADSFDDLDDSLTPSGDITGHNIAISHTAGNFVLSTPAPTVTASSEDGAFVALNAIDGGPCTEWRPAVVVGSWLALEWSSALTIDTVKVVTGRASGPVKVDVWKNGAWMMVAKVDAPAFPLNVSFTPVITTKLRLRSFSRIAELEAYNLYGAAPADTVTGTVTSGVSGSPVKEASVTDGVQTVFTSESGKYFLASPAGPQTVTASKRGFSEVSQPVTSPGTLNLVLPSQNIAPIATVAGSSELAGRPATQGNDTDYELGWMSDETGSEVTYQLEWSSAKTIGSVVLADVVTNTVDAGHVDISYWDGSNWVLARRSYGLPSVGVTPSYTVGLYPVTSTKLQLKGVIGFAEVEVLQTDGSSIVTGPISTIRNLPDGTPVQIVGSVTACFGSQGYGYVESLDRTSAIRVEPAEKLGYSYTLGPNIAPEGTASAVAEHPSYPAACANDGDFATEWYAGMVHTGFWLQIEWPEARKFNTVVVYNYPDPRYLARTYAAEVWDGSQWVTASTVVNPSSYVVTFSFGDVTATKVRIINFDDIYEMEVYDAGYDCEALDREVTVGGVLATVGGDRTLIASVVSVGAVHPLGPLGMVNRTFSCYTTGNSAFGPENGLLVSTWGLARSAMGTGLDRTILADDGSHALVKCWPAGDTVQVGDYVKLTGIAGRTESGVRSLIGRSTDDITKIATVATLQMGPNLAPGGTASADYADPRWPATNANDGNLTTEWYGGMALGHWVEISWASPQTFNTVVIRNYEDPTYLGRDYTVEAWDGAQWVPVATVSNPPGFVVTLQWSISSTTNKVRVLNVSDLYEMEVYNATLVPL